MNSKPFFATTRDQSYSAARKITDALLNLFYPDACFICDVPVARQCDCSICDDCWQKALKLQIVPPWCSSCGLPLPDCDPASNHLCLNCTMASPSYSGARSFGYYTSELRRLIHGLKFDRRRNLTGLLAPVLASTFLQSWDRDEMDLVVPVPLHPKRNRERGFNQAGLLARALAECLALPYCERALVRLRHTKPQVVLSHTERMRNLNRAFVCRTPEAVAEKRVLLIDDVMTTGATAASASLALLEAGALRVSVLTVARAVIGIE